MQQRRGTPLPPPTPTELAAVRALVDTYRNRRTSRGVVVLSVVLVLAVAVIGFVTLSQGDIDRWFPWQLLVGAAGAAVNAREFTTHQRRARRSVSARLGESPSARPPVRRPVLSTFERWAFTFCLALAGVLVASAVLLADGGMWAPFAWALAVGAVSGSLAASISTVLRDPLVGQGDIVPAVDSAIRRRQLAGVAGAAVPLLLAVSWAAPATLVPLGVSSIAANAGCIAIAWFVRQDDVLLRDPRLADAPAPEQWLTGTAS